MSPLQLPVLFLLLLLLLPAANAKAESDVAEGIVTFAMPGKLYLRTGAGGQLVIWDGTPALSPGDKVRAEGQWTPAKFKDALRADRVFLVERVGEVEPVPLEVHGPWTPKEEGELVTVNARVMDSLTTDAEIWLYGVAEDRPFRAVMKLRPGMGGLDRIEPGSMVRLTGLCDLLPSEGRPDRGATDFQIQLRDAGDVRILSRPSWWTTGRLGAVLAGLVAVIAVTGAWVVWLRRRVEAQAQAIGEHVARAAVQEDRQRIARELHDTLEQELTGLRLQIETASVQIENQPAAAREALRNATALLAHSQRETRETLHDLREESRKPEGAAAFCEAVKERIGARCEGAGVALGVSLEGAERPFGRQCMHHLLRITTEAATNALKHAGARSIKVVLEFGTEALAIRVSDDGVGCRPDALEHPPAGHFGVRGMRERAAKFGGTLDIQSVPGLGTTLTLTVPYG